MVMREEILTVRELARYLKMNEHTIYRLARKGVLPGAKIGGEWKFRKDLIDKWIEEESLSKKSSKNNR